MPALTKKQIEELTALMRQRNAVLLEEIREELARSGEPRHIEMSGRVTDIADESVADMLADIDAAMIDRQVKEVRDIEAALGRMESGEYGECIDCGANIAHSRLLAYPTAKRCIRCQELRERQFAEESQHTL
jgi:DnaK suppressor protein